MDNNNNNNNNNNNSNNRKNFISNNEGFICENCGKEILPLHNGSCRNHCPYCFYSKHVDNVPGDRLSNCGGLMKPVGYDYNSKKGYVIIHNCAKCGKEIKNILAFDDSIQADNYEYFLELVKKFSLTKC